MERIELDEVTIRLRRNLVVSAFLIIIIKYFGIKVEKIQGAGLEFSNLTTEVVLLILIAIMIYHFVAFGVRALEEFKFWQQTFADKDAAAYGGSLVTVTLASKLEQVADILDAITKNGGLIVHQGQTIISEGDAGELKKAATAANTYAKRLKNFPYITGTRFLAWDIGFAVVTFVVALVMYWKC